MKRSRRSFLQDAIALSATLTADRIASATEQSQSGSRKEPAAVRKLGYKRIATEEAWGPSDLLATYQKMVANKSIDDPGFSALWARLGANAHNGMHPAPHQRASHVSCVGARMMPSVSATLFLRHK